MVFSTPRGHKSVAEHMEDTSLHRSADSEAKGLNIANSKEQQDLPV